jgi:hypothetical protein
MAIPEGVWAERVAAGFHPCEPVQYEGNARAGAGRKRAYHLRLDDSAEGMASDGEYELTYLLQLPLGCAAAINRGKRRGGQPPGGSFVVNEFGHVLVPTISGTFWVGTLLSGLLLESPDGLIVAVPGSVRPGQSWPYPPAGVRYVLNASTGDVRYQAAGRSWVRERQLSDFVGTGVAARIASQLGRYKSRGGSIYLGPGGFVTGPVEGAAGWSEVFLGYVDLDRWFPQP